MKRRKFLKISFVSFLGITFLPKISFSFSNEKKTESENNFNRFWLSGSPKLGCSTSPFSFEFSDSLENGLEDFYSFRLPQNYLNFPHYDILA
jgi:hypothetical protein